MIELTFLQIVVSTISVIIRTSFKYSEPVSFCVLEELGHTLRIRSISSAATLFLAFLQILYNVV